MSIAVELQFGYASRKLGERDGNAETA
jgi:hypothetical protein